MFTQLHMSLIPVDLHELVRPQIDFKHSPISIRSHFKEFKLFDANGNIKQHEHDGYVDKFDWHPSGRLVDFWRYCRRTLIHKLSFHPNGALLRCVKYHLDGHPKESYVFREDGTRVSHTTFERGVGIVESISWDEHDVIKYHQSLRGSAILKSDKYIIDLKEENAELKAKLDKLMNVLHGSD